MINFEEELKKYTPSVEISQAEDTIQQSDISDVMDIIDNILKKVSKTTALRPKEQAGDTEEGKG